MYDAVADRLAAWCHQHSLKRLVIGYSGGLDSSVMLHLAWRFTQQYPELSLLAVYVDHGLQSASQHWAMHCAEQAQQFGIPYQVQQLQLALKPRTSLEALARDARYHALAEHVTLGTALLTGHHLDDQAETLLLALKRGSGVKGLAAMGEEKAFAKGVLLRPLLNHSRSELENYAQRQQLSWVEDSSNQQQVFDRNFLRHRILPELETRWPGAKQAIARSASHCAESQLLLDELALSDFGEQSAESEQLPINLLTELSVPRRNNLLRFWLAQNAAPMPSAAILGQIWSNVATSKADATALVEWQGWQLRRYQGLLYLLPKTTELSTEPVSVGADLRKIALADGRQLYLQPCNHGIRLRLPARELLQVRFGVSGLRLHPHNRPHSRQLKKLWQEWRVPPWLRAQVPLLFYGEQLVAVVGYGLERSYLAEGYEPGLVPRLG